MSECRYEFDGESEGECNENKYTNKFEFEY